MHGNTSISQYIKVEIMKIEENILMRARRLLFKKNSKKMLKITQKWPKILPENSSFITRAYFSRKKCYPDFEN